MKIIYLQNGMHHKNHHAMINYKNIQLFIINNPKELDSIDLTQFDCVYSPATPIDASKYPKTKFIFGPHFSIFPIEDQIKMIKYKNAVYNLLCPWVINSWKLYSISNDLNIVNFPFGVDTQRFNTNNLQNKTEILIYYKHRHPSELQFICNELNNLSIKYSIFSYKHRYDENTYIEYLKKTKYCIWIDAHESQGFALQEALSCNVPLLVWNVVSMNQEYGGNHNDIPATTIPHWDARCGEVFYNKNDFKASFMTFLSKIETYQPRDFILENLTFDICETKLINTINNITI